MGYVAALHTNGRTVTGMNHGDAFGKLSPQEQDGKLISGFLDSKTGKFIEDDIEFYVKDIFLIRHSDVQSQQDNPSLSEEGRRRASAAANFLSTYNLNHYQGYVSIANRCLETACILQEKLKIDFYSLDELRDKEEKESSAEFLNRLQQVLDTIPENSIIITHLNCVISLAHLATYGGILDKSVVSVNNGTVALKRCSISYVAKGKIEYFGKIIS